MGNLAISGSVELIKEQVKKRSSHGVIMDVANSMIS